MVPFFGPHCTFELNLGKQAEDKTSGFCCWRRRMRERSDSSHNMDLVLRRIVYSQQKYQSVIDCTHSGVTRGRRGEDEGADRP